MSDFFQQIKMPPWAKIDRGASDTTPLLSDSASGSSSDSGGDSSAITSRRPPVVEPRQSRRGPASSPGATGDGYFDDGPAWSDPLGGPSRGDNDEHLVMFRRAVGINGDLPGHQHPGQGTLEEGRGAALGIYRTVIRQERRKRLVHHAVSGMVWGCHGVQIVVGATLTCLGLRAKENAAAITVLGAVNTVVAGFLALVKGKSLPEKLGRTEADFRQLKVWIEETESLLALGVIGSDRREVGSLIQTAFRRFNACSGRSFEVEADMDRGVGDFGAQNDEDNEAGYIDSY